MFDGNPYFAAMSTRDHELLAYGQCTDEIKDAMVPIVTLTRRSTEDTLRETASIFLNDIAGRAAIVDFDPEPRVIKSAELTAERRRRLAQVRVERGEPPARARSAKELANDEERRRKTSAFNRNVAELMDPVNGAVRWTDMMSDFPGLLPVLRATTAAQVAQQLAIIGRKGTQAAFRLKPSDETGTSAFFDNIRGIKEMSGSLLVILDLEDIRGQVEPSAKVAKAFFARLFESMGDGAEDLETVLLANSFPRGSLRELPRTLPIQEVKLHSDVATTFPVRYGDYMSIPPRMSTNQTRNGWLPHVDFITSGYWNVHLHDANRDSTKFIEASTEIVGEDNWRSRIDCWGTSVITRVKETEDLSVDGRKFTQPAPWITVRANQHLTMMASNR